MLRLRSLPFTLTCLAALFCLAVFASPAAALGPEDPPEPTPGPTPDPSFPGFIDPRLKQPVLPENPTLADKGAQTWWSVCMACHGDFGQGLTDEWRQTAFGEDNNCWESKCHGPMHPPQGFSFPRIVPPAWGQGTLKRFVTADELQVYLLDSMPWWNPGSLTVDQSWEVTAFLLREHGSLPAQAELDVENSSLLPVHLPIRSAGNERSWQTVWIGLLILAAVAWIAGRSFTRSPTAEPLSTLHPPPAAVDSSLRRQRSSRASFFHHLHPATIPADQARWWHTLGAGGIAVFLSLVLLLTGLLETFFYIPTPEEAAVSIQTITFLVPFGGVVRGLHFWSAQALVVVVVIHLLRVVFTGAFGQPRRFNYLLGLALLVIVLFLDFTGYVLRWDEGIRWALMVGTNLLKTIPGIGPGLYAFVVGGRAPGAATLIRFYGWHLYGLTALMLVLVAWHIFRVRRDGGIAAPPAPSKVQSEDLPEGTPVASDGIPSEKPPSRISRSDLVHREVLAMLVLSAVLGLAAILLPAPLAPPIQDSPTALIADSQAPWFFLWIQQLLRLGDAFWLGVALPVGLVVLLVAVPYCFPHLAPEDHGRWFGRSGRGAQFIAAAVVVFWLVLTLLEIWIGAG